MSTYNQVLLLGMFAWLCVGMAIASIPYKSKEYGKVTVFQLPFAMRRIPPTRDAEESLRGPGGVAAWAASAAVFWVGLVVLWPVNAARFAIRWARRRRSER